MVAYRSRIRDVTAVIVLLLFMCHQTTTTAAPTAATAQQAEHQQQQGDRIERDVDEDEIKQAAQVTIGNLNNST